MKLTIKELQNVKRNIYYYIHYVFFLKELLLGKNKYLNVCNINRK